MRRRQVSILAGLLAPLAHAVAQPAAGVEFQAPDKSFSTRIPAGWRVRTTMLGAQPVNLFEPEGGGDERILVSSGVALAHSIQEMAQQAPVTAMQSLGLRATGAPTFTQVAGSPAAEIKYAGVSAAGRISSWNGIIFKDRFFFAVLSLARPEKAGAVERQARSILLNMRPAQVPENLHLARAIVGRWTFSQGSSSGASASRMSSAASKRVVFLPNGRFQYAGGVFPDSNLPGGGGAASGNKTNTGTYHIFGNTLYSQIDGGGNAVFKLELIERGGLKIDGMLFIRE